MSQATAILLNWNAYPNFTEDEFRCKCGCGRADMKPQFLNFVQLLRTACGFPFVITSGFRCEKHDSSIGGAGVHPSGQACDLNVYGVQALAILDHRKRFGFNRIGLKQTGRFNSRFVHIDTLTKNADGDDIPSPWVWTYK